MVLISALLLGQQNSDLLRFLPGPNYSIVMRMSGEFLRPGVRQTAFVATAQGPAERNSGKGPFACIVSGGRILWKHHCSHQNSVIESTGGMVRPPLQAIDVTGDGHPELVFVSTSLGSDLGQTAHLVHWNGRAFVESSPGGTGLEMGKEGSLYCESQARPPALHHVVLFQSPADLRDGKEGIWVDRKYLWRASRFEPVKPKEVRSPEAVLHKKGVRLIY